MRKQSEIVRGLSWLAFVLILGAPVASAAGITTGDLIVAAKDAAAWPPAALERPELTHIYDTEAFKIHYEVEGPFAVYNPDEDIDPADGTPDYVNRMAEFLESSRYTYELLLEYDSPPPDEGMGGDDRYDVYVTNTPGLTVPEFPSDYYPGRMAFTSYSLIGNDLRNEYHPTDPIPFLMATCAHEYFHAIQLAYRGYAADETPWWYELTACWAEERVFDSLNEIYFYLTDYFLRTERSIYLTGGPHMYGAWVFAEYLSQKYGVQVVRQVFDKLISIDNSLTAIEAVMGDMGVELNSEFSIFGAWNYFTGVNYRGGFFEEGEDFPVTVSLAAEHSSYPTGEMDSPRRVENLGLVYVYFENPGFRKCDLIIQFAADEQYPQQVSIAAARINAPATVITSPLAAGQDTVYRVEDFEGCEGVVLCVSGQYEGYSLRDSAGYRYSADVDSITNAIIAEDDQVPREFYIAGNYPNPFNSTSNIIFGWNFGPVDYTLLMFTAGGRLVDIRSGIAATGLNRINWTPAAGVASGVYYYRLLVGGKAGGGSMLFLK